LDSVLEINLTVGTCNGLICLCDGSQPGGAITLTNPSNGETLVLPPLPCADSFMRGRSRWHQAYGFAHHQGTGRYKVVRIPCCFDRQNLDTATAVQVFTLGEASWREVATPTAVSTGARCLRGAGIVGVDGAVYWVADGTERIMSFDLEDECVTSVKPLPVPLPTRSGSSFRLAEVHGRLGIAIFHYSAKLDQEKTDVWVLESARGEQRWRRWYSVEMSVQPPQQLTLPHFAHGKHVLMHGGGIPYRYEPNGTRKKSRYGMVQISATERGTEAVTDHIYQAFAYVETKEPLNNYKLW
jgi:F-box interacting protein